MAQLSLNHLRGKTYLIPSPTNVGIFVEGDNAILIDGGSDREAAKQILRLLQQHGWSLKLTVNTHSHADHIGGNAFLQEKTRCRFAATRGEAGFISDPFLEPSFLYGGFPHRGMQNKFLMARPSSVTDIIPASGKILDTGLEAVPLPGHFFGMIGIMTPDGVFFLADSLIASSIIEKYHVLFLYDIGAHLETLEKLKSIDAELYIPSHGDPLKEVHSLVDINKRKVYEIAARVQDACQEPATAEEVLVRLCTEYGLTLNTTQFLLLSSTVRSYLSYLFEEGVVEYTFADNRMLWRKR